MEKFSISKHTKNSFKMTSIIFWVLKVIFEPILGGSSLLILDNHEFVISTSHKYDSQKIKVFSMKE